MSFHAILALTHPTDADAKKARITEEIVTAAEVVFAEGMSIPEDKVLRYEVEVSFFQSYIYHL